MVTKTETRSEIRIEPKILQSWLEWAAAKLIAMPAGRLKPQAPRALWPDFAYEPIPGASDLRTNRLRALAPSSAEISIVDSIIFLPNLCEKEETRKVLHWRAQVHPITLAHINKWNWIAHKFDVRIMTVQRWHKKGLEEVCAKADQETICRVTAFLSDQD